MFSGRLKPEGTLPSIARGAWKYWWVSVIGTGLLAAACTDSQPSAERSTPTPASALPTVGPSPTPTATPSPEEQLAQDFEDLPWERREVPGLQQDGMAHHVYDVLADPDGAVTMVGWLSDPDERTVRPALWTATVDDLTAGPFGDDHTAADSVLSQSLLPTSQSFTKAISITATADSIIIGGTSGNGMHRSPVVWMRSGETQDWTEIPSPARFEDKETLLAHLRAVDDHLLVLGAYKDGSDWHRLVWQAPLSASSVGAWTVVYDSSEEPGETQLWRPLAVDGKVMIPGRRGEEPSRRAAIWTFNADGSWGVVDLPTSAESSVAFDAAFNSSELMVVGEKSIDGMSTPAVWTADLAAPPGDWKELDPTAESVGRDSGNGFGSVAFIDGRWMASADGGWGTGWFESETGQEWSSLPDAPVNWSFNSINAIDGVGATPLVVTDEQLLVGVSSADDLEWKWAAVMNNAGRPDQRVVRTLSHSVEATAILGYEHTQDGLHALLLTQPIESDDWIESKPLGQSAGLINQLLKGDDGWLLYGVSGNADSATFRSTNLIDWDHVGGSRLGDRTEPTYVPGTDGSFIGVARVEWGDTQAIELFDPLAVNSESVRIAGKDLASETLASCGAGVFVLRHEVDTEQFVAVAYSMSGTAESSVRGPVTSWGDLDSLRINDCARSDSTLWLIGDQKDGDDTVPVLFASPDDGVTWSQMDVSGLPTKQGRFDHAMEVDDRILIAGSVFGDNPGPTLWLVVPNGSGAHDAASIIEWRDPFGSETADHDIIDMASNGDTLLAAVRYRDFRALYSADLDEIVSRVNETGTTLQLTSGQAGGLAVHGEVVERLQRITPDIVVADDGFGDFTSLADAVEAADSGDLIHVEPGTYVETRTVVADETYLRIQGTGDSPEEVTIIGSSKLQGTTLYSIDSQVQLSNMSFTSNLVQDGDLRFAVVGATGSLFWMDEVVVFGGEGPGLDVSDTGGAIVASEFRENLWSGARARFTEGGRELVVSDSTFANNGNSGFSAAGPGMVTVTSNQAFRNGTGFSFFEEAEAVVTGNNASHNEYSGYHWGEGAFGTSIDNGGGANGSEREFIHESAGVVETD